MTLQDCIKKVAGMRNSLPVFINTNNTDEYKNVVQGFSGLNIVRVSDFCNDEFPDIDNFSAEVLSKITCDSLVLGLNQVLNYGKKEEMKRVFSEISTRNFGKNKVIFLTYKNEDVLNHLIDNDKRCKDNRVFLLEEKPTPAFQCYISKYYFEVAGYSAFASFGKFLNALENNGDINAIVKTQIPLEQFENSCARISALENNYDVLRLLDPNSSLLSIEWGNEKQWQTLREKVGSYLSINAVLNKYFGAVNDYVTCIYNWQDYDDFKKWLSFIALKLKLTSNSYLSLVIDNTSSVDEFVHKLYVKILDIDFTNKAFEQFYDSRKTIIKQIDNPKERASLVQLAACKGKEGIHYLTDLNEYEKKEIIKFIGKYAYKKDELNSILQKIYPDLYVYLLPLYFENDKFEDIKEGMLSSYFQQYKLQKLNNRIDDSFLEYVNSLASNRNIYFLPSRAEELEKIDRENSHLFFFDAFGVEFLSYFSKRCHDLGLICKVHICISNLPTITCYNNEFFNKATDTNIKDLDEIKHSGEGDYDFTKTEYPIHLVKELEIIDKVIEQAVLKLNTFKKVIIVSDHGASRLAVINKNEYQFDVDSKGTHGGRCCSYSPEIEGRINYSTGNENGFCVLASYDRFKGGMKARVETHGGASLEEMVIPIIEITKLNKDIHVKFESNEIQISFRDKAELLLISDSILINPLLRINSKIYQAVKSEGTKYYFSLPDITKTNMYYADVLDGDNIIMEKLQFNIIKKSTDKNLL